MEEIKIESAVEELLKTAKKQGTITEEEIGAALIDYDLTSEELKKIVEKFTAEGITVENDEEILKDDDLIKRSQLNELPEKIGEYVRTQYSLDNAFYIKKNK